MVNIRYNIDIISVPAFLSAFQALQRLVWLLFNILAMKGAAIDFVTAPDNIPKLPKFPCSTLLLY